MVPASCYTPSHVAGTGGQRWERIAHPARRGGACNTMRRGQGIPRASPWTYKEGASG